MHRTVVIGLLGFAAIAMAVALTFWWDLTVEMPLNDPNRLPATVPQSALVEKSVYEGAPAAQKEAAHINSSEATSVMKPAQWKPVLPSFDIVRVNQEGDAVIAGRAEPEAIVTVFDGKTIIGTIVADQKGEWVMVPAKPLPSGDRALSVIAKNVNGDELKSDGIVILAVPESNTHRNKTLAVIVPREGLATERVLQKPSISQEERSNYLSLEFVDYDEAGRLRLSGYANPAHTVLVYINNNSIGRTVATVEGTWELRPADALARGVYTLRIDEVKDRKVIARIELPFTRAEPPTGLTKEKYVTVQPGNSLWRISRRILGQGTKYTVIYEANKNQIRDADLIYPGQVFAITKPN
ncbi:MAG: peptidoglycan-binding protein LysM [Rickettsiales bacterium]|nr:peptidoglycan-binding protein LysM [Rickettsiales bacterium]